MTTPGGVPNLPTGALTLDTLASRLQDMSGEAMKSRAVERFPGTFNASTGGTPALDLTPFGILTRIWAEVTSLIANADPADIQGPEDLPELFLEFIEGLPVVGQFIDILQAIIGQYDGDDPVLLAVQDIFAPIRELMELVAGTLTGGIPSVDDIVEGWGELTDTVSDAFERVLTLGGLFNISNWDDPPSLTEFLTWLANQLNPLNLLEAALPANIRSNLEAALGGINLDVPTIDFDPADVIPPQLQQLGQQVTSGFAGLFNSWFGTNTGTGTAGEVETTVSAIKSAIVGGYTIYTLTGTGNFVVPQGTEFIISVTNGGNGGQAGTQNGGTIGGAGGQHGGFLAAYFTADELGGVGATIPYSCGNGGAGGSGANFAAGGVGGVTQFGPTGSPLLAGVSGTGGIEHPAGFLTTTSMPGAGGDGGGASAPTSERYGRPGGSTPLAAGGVGGTTPGTSGGDGADGAAAAVTDTPAGGGGGGGGGGSNSFGGSGGDGGNGGNYGAGGGGGASCPNSGGTRGRGGDGAPGVIYVKVR